ncbi:MAG: type II toxin-antitoxin system RelE/ParE family toxin [Terriglobia bacterium]
MFEIVHYQKENGHYPFSEWLSALRDRMAKARIDMRLHQVESGNLGGTKPVGEGVMELRVHVGAGYRVYCGRHGQSWIVLLCGGDKDSQSKDIARAKVFWADWKRRNP